MKRFIFLVVLLFASLTSAVGTTYTTNFPNTENPISESGKWVNGGTTGLDWTDVRISAAGQAVGTEASVPFSDSTAILQGGGLTWTQNQTVSGVIFVNTLSQSCGQELELRLNSTISAHVNNGYEIDYPVHSGTLAIVRWNGPLANPSNSNNGFTVLAQVSGVTPQNGDTLSATNVNGVITVFVNGVQKLQATDTTYTAGSPGVGVNYTQEGTCVQSTESLKYGFTSFTASDSGNPPPPPSCPGPYNILAQPPLNCRPEPNSYLNQLLPTSVTSGAHDMPGSAAIVANMMTHPNGDGSSVSVGLTSMGQWHSYGTDDFGSNPIYFGQSTDPTYTVNGCTDGGSFVNGQTFHAPSGASYNQGTNDREIVIFDQTDMKAFEFYGGAGGPTALPACGGSCSFTAYGGYCSESSFPNGTGWGAGNAVSNSLAPYVDTILLQEIQTQGHIKHQLHGYTYCNGKGSAGQYPSRTVFPANAQGGAVARACNATTPVTSDTNRPPNGALFYLDYTQADLDCFDPSKSSCTGISKLNSVQFAIIEAVTKYGTTLAGTGDGDSLAFPYLESEEPYRFYDTQGYSGAKAIADSFTPYMNGKCTSPWCSITSRSLPHSTSQWNLTGWAGISNVRGGDVTAHLHIADPCVALGMAGQPGGCVSVAQVPSTPTGLTATPH